MNNNINYYNKYLKYKIKYNALRNTLIKQVGGACDEATKKIIENLLISYEEYTMIQQSNDINLKIALLIDNVRVLGNLYKDKDAIDSYIFCIFNMESKSYRVMSLEEVCTAYTNRVKEDIISIKTDKTGKIKGLYIRENEALTAAINERDKNAFLKNRELNVSKTRLQLLREGTQTRIPSDPLVIPSNPGRQAGMIQIPVVIPNIEQGTKDIIKDSTNHIKNSKSTIIRDASYFTHNANTSTYLEKSVNYLKKQGTVDNIILVDGLNVIRSSLLCKKVLKWLISNPQPQQQQDVIAKCGTYINDIKTHQEEKGKKHNTEDRDTYDEKSNYLLINFLPYILTYVKTNRPAIIDYKFVICCKYQIERKKFTFDMYTESSLDYIFIRSYGEDDDFLLLLLYSYFKNILKLKETNILILSRDNYEWWPNDNENSRGDTEGYIYTKNYIDKSIFYK